jgi:hypothetical protein
VLQSSACWQWRETVTILRKLLGGEQDHPESLLNNHVLAAVLHLNERASTVWSTTSPRCGHVRRLLDWMKEYNVTRCRHCTLLLSSLSTEAIAVELLRDMQQQQPSA